MARSRAAIVALVVASCAGAARVASHPAAAPAVLTNVMVVDVVDGDTLVVRTRTGAIVTVRILGVDTPETVHPRRGVECFGPEASAYSKQRLHDRRVTLRTDAEARDIYGRLLADVEIDGASYARELLRLGLARFFVIAPNDHDARALLAAETDARRHERGLWGRC